MSTACNAHLAKELEECPNNSAVRITPTFITTLMIVSYLSSATLKL